MPGAQPHAHAYCGHQFGSFAGQLGDGAAMYLGEVEGPSGRWEGGWVALQLGAVSCPSPTCGLRVVRVEARTVVSDTNGCGVVCL